MKFSGKSREEVAAALASKTRDELVDIIFSVAVIEQHFTPSEIASRSGMTKRTVLADIHAGRFGDEYFKRSPNQITVSASGIHAWRNSFRVEVKHQHRTHSR